MTDRLMAFLNCARAIAFNRGFGPQYDLFDRVTRDLDRDFVGLQTSDRMYAERELRRMCGV